MSVGSFPTVFSTDEVINSTACAIWVSFTFLVPLLYVNVLIAMMSKSFEKIGKRSIC